MKCTNSTCGKELDPGFRMCPFCGTAVPQKPHCSQCGEELDPAFKMCPYCGTPAACAPAVGAAPSVERFDCVDGSVIRPDADFFQCQECQGYCLEENRVKHPKGLKLGMCRNCGDALVRPLWEKHNAEKAREEAERKHREEEERKRKAEEARKKREQERKRREEEERKRKAEEARRKQEQERKAEAERKRREEEERKRREEAKRKKREQKEVELDCGGGVMLKLKRIEAGSFMMGGKEEYLGEKPIHQVSISEPFYLGIYLITQAQYEAVTGENPSDFSGEPDSPQRPVENVSWEEAKLFCQKLSQKTGKRFGLPSEAQWEYACRAGSTSEYCFGDAEGELELYANYEKTPIYGDESTSPVGLFKPNAWGLHDMHGNVWEWCEDKWHSNYEGAPTDGSPWLGGGDSNRVYRGGSWHSYASFCRSASRSNSSPGFRYNNLGFRLLMTAS